MAESETVEKMKDLNVNSIEEDDFVDPWTVSSKSEKGLDYDKLISKYKTLNNFYLNPKA